MPSPSAPPLFDPSAACPADEELAAFVEGTLAPAAVLRLEAHVDACPLCHRVLASLGREGKPGAATTLSSSASSASFASTASSDSASQAEAVAAVSRWQSLRPLAPGSTLGRFVILAWIGQGAMGVVYSAHDPELDRNVALKLMPPANAAEREDVRARMVREARAMGKATHPNVVTVYEVGTFEDRVFLAMELVAGTTLREWLAAAPRAQAAILRVFQDAGHGLAAAHGAGLVHRDFKPSNVLIGDDGRVRVSDFGLASPAERSASIAGTPAYMAPEQKEGGQVDARSDQFSFCVALYEALYGEHPFEARGLETTDTALRAPPARSRVPGRLRAVLARGLSRDPEKRHASMADLLAALSFDPRARWRGISIAVAAVVALASLGVAYREHRAGAGAIVCRGAERQLAGVWDAARKADIHRAFQATDKPYAEEAFRAVATTLDGYTGEWVTAHTDACEATHVRGEQSAQLLDLRMACLNDRLNEVRALTTVLTTADGTVALNAQKAAHSLGSLSSCADVHALAGENRKEPPAAAAAGVEAAREKVALVEATRRAGKVSRAATLAVDALADARATGFRPLIAEALYEQGQTLGSLGDTTATQILERAAVEADAAGDDRIRAKAWIALVYEFGSHEGRAELLPFLRDQAAAAIDRSGGDAAAEFGLHMNTSAALIGLGKSEDARAELESALSLYASAHLDRPLDAVAARVNLAVVDLDEGKLTEAIAQLDQVLDETGKLVGENHPYRAFSLGNRGTAREENLDFAGAKEDFDRARAMTELTSGASGTLWAGHLVNDASVLMDLGQFAKAVDSAKTALGVYEAETPDADETGIALSVLGQAYVGSGDPAAAIPILERAVTFEDAESPDMLAAAQFVLARALLAGGAGARKGPAVQTRARELAEKARDIYRGHDKVPLFARDLAIVEAWLAAQSRGSTP